MQCNNSLAFIDLEKIATPVDFVNGILNRRVTVTRWWNPIHMFRVQKTDITKDMCAFNDWFAFACLYIAHCIKQKQIPAIAVQFNMQYGKRYGAIAGIKLDTYDNMLKEAILLYSKANLYFNLGIVYEIGAYNAFVATIPAFASESVV